MPGIGKKICAEKKAYNELGAQQAIYVALISGRPVLRQYLCQYCKRWHLTHKTKKEYQEKLASVSRGMPEETK